MQIVKNKGGWEQLLCQADCHWDGDWNMVWGLNDWDAFTWKRRSMMMDKKIRCLLGEGGHDWLHKKIRLRSSVVN